MREVQNWDHEFYWVAQMFEKKWRPVTAFTSY
jgi:hypothetical protein